MTDFTADIQAFMRRHGYTHLTPHSALFDMDGTLYDSMPRHAHAWMNMCAEEGLEAQYNEFSGSKAVPAPTPSTSSLIANTATTPHPRTLSACTDAKPNCLPHSRHHQSSKAPMPSPGTAVMPQ